MKTIGYKVMAFEEDTNLIRSGANGNLNYSLGDEIKEGSVLEMDRKRSVFSS